MEESRHSSLNQRPIGKAEPINNGPEGSVRMYHVFGEVEPEDVNGLLP